MLTHNLRPDRYYMGISGPSVVMHPGARLPITSASGSSGAQDRAAGEPNSWLDAALPDTWMTTYNRQLSSSDQIATAKGIASYRRA